MLGVGNLPSYGAIAVRISSLVVISGDLGGTTSHHDVLFESEHFAGNAFQNTPLTLVAFGKLL